MEGERCPVIVLAGGRGTRLGGRDKATEMLEGRTLLQRVVDATEPLAAEYVIVTREGQSLPEVASSVPLRTVRDAYPDAGPLGGIYTGLLALAAAGPPGRERSDLAEVAALVVACDMPLLQPDLLRALLRLAPGRQAVVPLRDGLPEPLCAVYSTACIEPVQRLLQRGAYKVAGILDDVDAVFVPETQWSLLDPWGLSFLNVNREEDLAEARRLISLQAPTGNGGS